MKVSFLSLTILYLASCGAERKVGLINHQVMDIGGRLDNSDGLAPADDTIGDSPASGSDPKKLAGGAAGVSSGTSAGALKDCTVAQVAKLLAPRTADQRSMSVKCNVKLKSTDVVYKSIIFEGASASGALFDCNGATVDSRGENPAGGPQIFVRSKLIDAVWSVPEDITIKNCTLYGGARIAGMSMNGEGDKLKESSHSLGHTARAQAAAPRRIVFDHMHIVTSGTIPLYFSPGVTDSALRRSRISGNTDSTSVYLDAESADNLLQNNIFEAQSSVREVVAVDASSRNTIVGNHFKGLGNGGIFLYRNCGEGGTVRHQSPHWNKIINNVFYYNKMTDDSSFFDNVVVTVWNFFSSTDKVAGPNPSIWVASRNGNRNYCDLDKGYDFGSSIDNHDLVKNTVILNNQIIKLDPKRMIRISDEPIVAMNNVTIDPTGSVSIPGSPSGRKSSCFAQRAFPNPYLADAKSASYFSVGDDPTAPPQCTGKKLTCDDGVLVSSEVSCADIPLSPQKIVPIQCLVVGKNGGCQKEVSCPGSMTVKAVRAVCNLESGTLDAKALNTAPWKTLKVDVHSDSISEGSCTVATSKASLGSALLNEVVGLTKFTIGCKEHDENGGDCHLLGQIVCE